MAVDKATPAKKPAAKPKTKAKAKRKPQRQRPRVGRPTLWEDRFIQIAKALAKLGATDLEVADALVVDIRTIYRWKLEHPEFADALKIGKTEADTKVQDSLYKLATGYSFDSVKVMIVDGVPEHVPVIEHVPPNAAAGIFWLKNRMPDQWRDTKNIKHDVEPDSPLADFMSEISGHSIKPKGA